MYDTGFKTRQTIAILNKNKNADLLIELLYEWSNEGGDIKDYAKTFEKTSGLKVFKMTKKPFGVQVKTTDSKIVHMKAEPSEVPFQFAITLQVK